MPIYSYVTGMASAFMLEGKFYVRGKMEHTINLILHGKKRGRMDGRRWREDRRSVMY
jgi:hypothetical protein